MAENTDVNVVDAKILRKREVESESYYRNAEERRERCRQYYQQNKERIRERNRNKYQKVGGEAEKRGRKRIDQSQTQPQE
jgi:hypothetical protein